ncbi:hypothetical protein AB8O55_25285 [Saccharopolyspora cebuensis]|uniref:Transcriptional regulator n=1 Tax=Saccharopolyspora cebuensis TaxID=418759 RepID=A0ABV4CNQ8_9PSEU
MISMIQRHIAELRLLDDKVGGGVDSVMWVRTQLRAVLDLWTQTEHEPEVGRALLRSASQLAQLMGWMSFDAGDKGRAQRAYVLAMRLAHELGDNDSVINQLGMLSYITAHTGSADEAKLIATQAMHLARAAHPVVRARTAGRLATACAAAGDLSGFRSAADEAQTLLQKSLDEPPPAFLYYFDSPQLAAESGQALVDLANPRISTELKTQRNRLLGQAVTALTPLAHVDHNSTHQRSALLHGCYLAWAHLRRGDIDSAAQVTVTAVRRLDAVQSGRCRSMVSDLRAAFGLRMPHPSAALAREAIDQAR